MGKFSREAALSEMDSQRALLDTLMGINRNLDREEDEITDWRDKRVCKCFLAGLCPHGRRLHVFINIAVECLLYLFHIEPIGASSPNSLSLLRSLPEHQGRSRRVQVNPLREASRGLRVKCRQFIPI